jgi:mono/diheme cytochrome c family protein
MLLTGQPVNDETVAAKIRDGGPRMPAYRHGLSDKDLADLVEYLREKCCWDENNPPRNPRYRY